MKKIIIGIIAVCIIIIGYAYYSSQDDYKCAMAGDIPLMCISQDTNVQQQYDNFYSKASKEQSLFVNEMFYQGFASATEMCKAFFNECSIRDEYVFENFKKQCAYTTNNYYHPCLNEYFLERHINQDDTDRLISLRNGCITNPKNTFEACQQQYFSAVSGKEQDTFIALQDKCLQITDNIDSSCVHSYFTMAEPTTYNVELFIQIMEKNLTRNERGNAYRTCNEKLEYFLFSLPHKLKQTIPANLQHQCSNLQRMINE